MFFKSEELNLQLSQKCFKGKKVTLKKNFKKVLLEIQTPLLVIY